MKSIDLVYSGERAIEIPDCGLIVQPGSTASIPADLAASLLLRPEWAEAKKSAPKGA